MDISAIAAAVQSIKSLKDIGEAMIALRDAHALQAKGLEFQARLLDAQGSIFAVNEERTTLIERVGKLEEEIGALKAWEREKQRYHLAEVGPGVFAYSVKPEEQGSEPAHLLCAKCYQDGKKSLLQATPANRAGRIRVHMCPECKTDFMFGLVPAPPPPLLENRSPGGPQN